MGSKGIKDQVAIIGSAADAYPSILERRHGYIRAMQNHSLDYAASNLLHPSR